MIRRARRVCRACLFGSASICIVIHCVFLADPDGHVWRMSCVCWAWGRVRYSYATWGRSDYLYAIYEAWFIIYTPQGACVIDTSNYFYTTWCIVIIPLIFSYFWVTCYFYSMSCETLLFSNGILFYAFSILKAHGSLSLIFFGMWAIVLPILIFFHS